jgi:hypothetical protein
MFSEGQSAINPALNVLQTVVAFKQEDFFLIGLFQNTPAAFHERPESSRQLTEELQQAVNDKR